MRSSPLRRRSFSRNRSVDRKSRNAVAAGILVAAASLSSSCSFFSRQPPLPRSAAIEATIAGDVKFSALVQDADIIYFPSESVMLTTRSEAPWKLLEALQRSGVSFALGWDSIAAEEQPVLDEWAKRAVSSGNAMPRIHFHAGPSDQEKCRAFLQEANRSNAHILALRYPEHHTRSLETAREFQPPPGDYERFAERSFSRGTNEAKLRAAYEAALLAEEFAAARIAGYFREHRNEKILVFLRREQLGRNHGVPYFVAQKTKARQLVLNSQQHSTQHSRLLAGNGRRLRDLWRAGRRLEIVNCSPVALRDQERFLLPGLGAGAIVRLLFLAPE